MYGNYSRPKHSKLQILRKKNIKIYKKKQNTGREDEEEADAEANRLVGE